MPFLSSLPCVEDEISFFVVFAVCGSGDIIFCRLCTVWELGSCFLSSLPCLGVGISLLLYFHLEGVGIFFFVVFALCGSWDINFCRLCTVWKVGYHFLSSLHCVGVGISFLSSLHCVGVWILFCVVFALCVSWDIILCRLCTVWELGYHFVSSVHCLGVGMLFFVVFTLCGSWRTVFLIINGAAFD